MKQVFFITCNGLQRRTKRNTFSPFKLNELKINRKGRIEVLKKGQKMLQKVQNEVFVQ